MAEAGTAQESALDDPVLGGPYDLPTRHFEIGERGPTDSILDGRRPSESFIPVATPKKGDPGGPQPRGRSSS